jgi:hypothetical protein
LIQALAGLPAAFSPPTVAETKRNFIEAYTRPIPAIYNTVLQELLVQQHFIRYGINYQYNAVSACAHRLKDDRNTPRTQLKTCGSSCSVCMRKRAVVCCTPVVCIWHNVQANMQVDFD